MKEKRNKRWRLIADLQIQGRLSLRLGIYWIACQMVMVATIFGFAFLTNSSGAGAAIFPALVASTLFLPIMLLDLIVFSNRFAGPMLTLRRALKQLAQSNSSEEIKFRDGDFYQDMENDFNIVRRKIVAKSDERSDAPMLSSLLPSLEINSPLGTEQNV